MTIPVNLGVSGGFSVLVFSLFLIFVFIVSRYRKFKTNQYVIHLRNGKIKSAGLGGSLIKLPLIDEIIVIPTTTQKTLLNAREKVLSREYQDLKITSILFWRVADPKQAFTAVVWDPRSPDYVEEILRNATEAIIRTTCASLPIETIIRERMDIIKKVTDQLHHLTKDWGIIIESLEIIEVEVLDKDLKKNMEAVKKITEERKARIAKADAMEVYRMRELEVQRNVGINEQRTQMEIMKERKNKEIIEQELEKKRMLIKAEAEKQTVIKQAEAEAEKIKLEKMAGYEAEARGIKMKMEAQAEGLLRQVEALKNADDRFIAAKLIEIMPQIFGSIKPDEMFIMGNGNDAFAAIAGAIMPFLKILPKFTDSLKDSFGKPGSPGSDGENSPTEDSDGHGGDGGNGGNSEMGSGTGGIGEATTGDTERISANITAPSEDGGVRMPEAAATGVMGKSAEIYGTEIRSSRIADYGRDSSDEKIEEDIEVSYRGKKLLLPKKPADMSDLRYRFRLRTP